MIVKRKSRRSPASVSGCPCSTDIPPRVFVKFRKNPTKEQLIEKMVNFKGLPQELKGSASAPEHFIRYMEEDDRPQVQLDVD